jgi:hypothetical protein
VVPGGRCSLGCLRSWERRLCIWTVPPVHYRLGSRASPPEMLRGPRWKKPDPGLPTRTVATPLPETTQSRESAAGDRDDEYDDDEEMKAAIEASLQSFEDRYIIQKVIGGLDGSALLSNNGSS